MKIALTIGYQTFLLPNDAGVSTLLKTLSKARHMEGHFYGQTEDSIKLTRRPVDVGTQVVHSTIEIIDERDLLQLPEHSEHRVTEN